MTSDLHPFMEDGPHSHENIFSDGRSVNDGSMTDMAIPPKPCSAVRKRMDDAIFLNVGPVPYLDILTLIDLLNGAGEWNPWNGTQRPVNTQCP